jgi:putative FmdB family regulatory protein
MPTYQYRCAKCGEEFELWQSIHDDALTRHPGCGGEVTKVFAPAGIVLKGSGFYRTDSRTRAGKGSGDVKEKEPAKEGSTSGNGSADAKGSSESKASTSSKESKDTKKDAKGSKSGSSST